MRQTRVRLRGLKEEPLLSKVWPSCRAAGMDTAATKWIYLGN